MLHSACYFAIPLWSWCTDDLQSREVRWKEPIIGKIWYEIHILKPRYNIQEVVRGAGSIPSLSPGKGYLVHCIPQSTLFRPKMTVRELGRVDEWTLSLKWLARRKGCRCKDLPAKSASQRLVYHAFKDRSEVTWFAHWITMINSFARCSYAQWHTFPTTFCILLSRLGSRVKPGRTTMGHLLNEDPKWLARMQAQASTTP